jgi:hypothetical protein
MTTPTTTMSAAYSTFYSAITAAAPAVSASPPPGVVQGDIDYNALLTALADFGLVTADAVNVFAQDFQAIILEALGAGTLAASIVIAVETAIPKGP